MSHAATNWAIQQKGLKPATKIVLWHLADCHNPAQGCFPSQAYLAEACEMSRASINTHLNLLEDRGLIRRETTVDKATRRQRPTRYHLGCEDAAETTPEPEPVSRIRTRPVSKKRGEPCPNSDESRVQNLDSNLVKEPVRGARARMRGASPTKAAPGGEVASRDEASKRERIASWINGGPAICGGWITAERLGAMVEAGIVTEAQANGALACVGGQPLATRAETQHGDAPTAEAAHSEPEEAGVGGPASAGSVGPKPKPKVGGGRGSAKSGRPMAAMAPEPQQADDEPAAPASSDPFEDGSSSSGAWHTAGARAASEVAASPPRGVV